MALSPRLDLTQNSTLAVQLAPTAERARSRIAEALNGESKPSEACVCGATDDQLVLATRDGYALPFTTTLCGRCSLIRTSAPALLEESELAEDWATLCASDLAHASRDNAERGTHLVGALENAVATGSISHLGKQEGALLSAFENAGFTISGTLSAAAPVSMVVCSDLDLEANLLERFKLIYEGLEPGGHLVIDVPGITAVDTLYQGDLLKYLQGGKRWAFCASSLSALLTSTQFSVLHADDSGLVLARREEQAPSSMNIESRSKDAATLVRYLKAKEKTIAQVTTRRAPVTASKPSSKTEENSPTGLPNFIQPFFCIGCQKSGTTLLARVIDQHPYISCMFESYALVPKSESSIMNPTSHKWRQHGFAEEQVNRWSQLWDQELSDPKLKQLMKLTGRQYPQLSGFAQTMPQALTDFATRTGAKIVGDKWPWYIDYLDIVLEVFPRAKFVYSVRDPRGLWNSAERFKNRNQGNLILHDMLRKDRQIAHHIDTERFLAIRYEDLVTEPEHTTRKLYDFLGMDFRPEYLNYDPNLDPMAERWSWVKEARDPFDIRHVKKWKDQMPLEQIRRVTESSLSFIEKYGYSA